MYTARLYQSINTQSFADQTQQLIKMCSSKVCMTEYRRA